MRDILTAGRFDPDAYALEGGMPDERLVLANEDQHWCVYYSERGYARSKRCYPTEHEACADLLERLRSDWSGRFP